jgi:hypothetical protein
MSVLLVQLLLVELQSRLSCAAWDVVTIYLCSAAFNHACAGPHRCVKPVRFRTDRQSQVVSSSIETYNCGGKCSGTYHHAGVSSLPGVHWDPCDPWDPWDLSG